MNTDYGICPNCGHDWTAHSDFIGRQERVCEEVLLNVDKGQYRLRTHYTDQNMLWYAQAYEGDLFVCQHHGNRVIARCKASITRRLKAI